MRDDLYALPPDYRPNELNVTLDAVSGEEYWDADRIATSARYQRDAYEVAASWATVHGFRRVVDVGCGVATKLTECFDPGRFELMGIDQPAAVEACRRLGRPGRYFADDLELPSYEVRRSVHPADLVISSDVIEHLLDPVTLLDYVRSIVAPDGHVMLTTPERDALHGVGSRSPTNPAHIREWSSDEFVRFLGDRGFEVLEVRVLRPFEFRPDRMTVGWLWNRIRTRLPTRTNLVVFCRPV